MDYHNLNGVKFVWDDKKALINAKKHKVTFSQACTAFFDPFFIVVEASDNSEYRQAIIGYDDTSQLLFVVYIETVADKIRIISARYATKQERRNYEQSN